MEKKIKSKKNDLEKMDKNLSRFQDIDIMEIDENPKEHEEAMKMFFGDTGEK